jgi:hypothetical protein
MSFEGKKLLALTEAADISPENYDTLLMDDEQVLMRFKSSRYRLVLTNNKIILVDTQDQMQKKPEFLVLPYSKITAFSVESVGTFDLDAEMKLYAPGLGMLEFTFVKGTDVKSIIKTLGTFVR